MKNCESNQAGMRQGENYFFKKEPIRKRICHTCNLAFSLFGQKTEKHYFFFSEEGINIKRQSQRKNEYIG